MKLFLDGITIDVLDADTAFYLRAGYKRIEEPVTTPAHEKVRSKRDKRLAVVEEAEKEEGET